MIRNGNPMCPDVSQPRDVPTQVFRLKAEVFGASNSELRVPPVSLESGNEFRRRGVVGAHRGVALPLLRGDKNAGAADLQE